MNDKIILISTHDDPRGLAEYQRNIGWLLDEAARLLYVPQHLLVINDRHLSSHREHEAELRAEFEQRLRDAPIVLKEPEVLLDPAPTCPPHEWGQRRHKHHGHRKF